MAANKPTAAFKDNYKTIFQGLVTCKFSLLTGEKILNQNIE